MRAHPFIVLALAVRTAFGDGSLATFTGGAGGGSARAEFFSTIQPTVGFQFFGGGGSGEVFSIGRTYEAALIPALARFAGNSNDGYASGRLFSTWSQVQRGLFLGGGFDGHDRGTLLSSWPANPPRRFAGGSYDGYDRAASLGNPTWILGDTDRNGLPDWWELQYFGVLTGTPTAGDADRDGASNLDEYLAATNPADAESVFRITSLAFGAPARVEFTCEPGLFYTLQRADDSLTNWTSVTSQIRVPAQAQGLLELSDPAGARERFYRVLIEH
jgi:hypothetical protein